MIARLSGRIGETGFDWAIVEVGGVGYEVFLPPSNLAELKPGDEVTLQIYEHVREDQFTLYGFTKAESKSFFTQLLGISGIGPKVALAVISSSSLENLRNAVAAGDPEVLRGVAGVGKKTAERIIVELRGKLEPAPSGANMAGNETYQALINLGYPSLLAAEAVATLPADVVDPAERVKLALKGLAK